jgi:phytoene/squalene synthetase
LQLVNHVQDVRRDLLDRDRIYLPAECTAGIPNFESRLRRTAELGYACDQQFLSEYRTAVRPMVDRCWKLLEEGRPLLPTLTDEAHSVIRLFIEGGERLLGNIESWNLETCIHRPKLSRAERGMLVMRAWWGARAPRWMRVGGPARGMASSGVGGTGGSQ